MKALEVIALNLEEQVESVKMLFKNIVSLDHTASVILRQEMCPTW